MKPKKAPLPYANAHADITGVDYSMSFSYDSQDKKVSIGMQGSPAAILGHLMRAFKGTGPLIDALASTVPKTDREIAQDTITERLQRRNPSLRPGYRTPAEKAEERASWKALNEISDTIRERTAAAKNPKKNPRRNSAKTPGKPRSAVRRDRKG